MTNAEPKSVAAEIDLIIESQPNWKGSLLAELRSEILSVSPDIAEAVKWKMPSKPLGSPVWELNGIICVADYLKNAVRLTFPKGASVADQAGIFNARLDSKTVRAIDFGPDETPDFAAIRSVILTAIKVNQGVSVSVA